MASTIPREAVEEFTRQINTISESMRKKLVEQLMQIDINSLGAKDVVIELMQTYCGAATDAAALATAQFYDASRAYIVGEEMGAVANSQRVADATRIATVGIIDKSSTWASAVAQLAGRLDYETKRASGDCMFYNGSRDPRKPHYARVPTGSETCMFCLMLASRGFVYRSAKSAGELDHYHANCDCRVVAGWGDDPQVAGYDTKKLYGQWQASMDSMAKDRAERNGTSVAEERSAIYRQLSDSAKKARQRNRSADSESALMTSFRSEIASATKDTNFAAAEANISRMQSQGHITGGQAQSLLAAISDKKKQLGI